MKNIKIVPPSLDLAPALFHTIKQNDAHLRRFLPWLDTVHAVADSEDFLAGCMQQEQQQEAVHRYIFCENILIGTVCVRGFKLGRSNVGYWLAKTHEGQGVMSFALQKLLAELEAQNLFQQPIYLRCRANNPASQRVAEKCDFVYQPHLKDRETCYGVEYDLRVYMREFV